MLKFGRAMEKRGHFQTSIGPFSTARIEIAYLDLRTSSTIDVVPRWHREISPHRPSSRSETYLCAGVPLIRELYETVCYELRTAIKMEQFARNLSDLTPESLSLKMKFHFQATPKPHFLYSHAKRQPTRFLTN